MTADEFREMALGLPETTEGGHMGHPDFRVGGKIFATLGPANAWAMVKSTPEAQADWMGAEPEAFEPFDGAWGRRGATKVHLDAASESCVRRALIEAWRNTAPKRLAKQHQFEEA